MIKTQLIKWLVAKGGIIVFFCFESIAAAQNRFPFSTVDVVQFASFVEGEVFDIQDLAEGAEVQRRVFNRMTPPGFAFVQPMSPSVVPFDAANFGDDFLDNLLGEDLLGVAVYPLALELDPQTRETSIFNADGDLLATYLDENSTRNWPEDSDPSRIILTIDLLPIEDVAPFLFAQERLTAAMRQEPEPVATRTYPASAFRFLEMQVLSNGTVSLSITNGADVVEIFSCNDLLANSWVCQTENLVLTNGSGTWEDPNPSPHRRFYAAVPFGDSDADGLRDSEEIFIYGTDPEHEDSDSDGMSDGWEVEYGFAPLTPDGHLDSDGDGLTNGQEFLAGTDPLSVDTDGDGIPDGSDPFPALKNCTIEKSLGIVLPIFHKKFQRGTGFPVYGGAVQVSPSGFVGNVIAITNITLFGTVDDSFIIEGTSYQWTTGAKAFSENITAAVSDKINGCFSVEVYDYIGSHVTDNFVALVAGAYNTNFGANCTFQYLTELRLYFSTTKATFCWEPNGTFSARSRLETDSYTGDRVEWSITTLAGSPASISTNGIVTYGAGGGHYRIRAAAIELPTCWDTMTLIVPKVDIEQSAVYVCKNCDCEETLNVTEDSYSPGGIIWESEPPGISGRGEQITYRPSSLAPDTYTVTARSAAHPACSDVSIVHVVQVKMSVPAGADEIEDASFGGFIPDRTVHTNASRTPLMLEAYGLPSAPGNLVLTWDPAILQIYPTSTSSAPLTQFAPPFADFTNTTLYIEGIAPAATTLQWHYAELSDCMDEIQVTVVRVEVTNIKFNHDTDSSETDAINIRQDYATGFDISNGEWVKGGHNFPACYTTNKSVTIRARFAVQPDSITSADIWAVSTDSDGSLGDLLVTNVTFSSGVSSPIYVPLQVAGTTPSCVQKTIQDFWQWKVKNINDSASPAWDMNPSGVHTVYTILTEPAFPWENSSENPQNAWASILDLSCMWAQKAMTIGDVVANITSNSYANFGKSYDGTQTHTFGSFCQLSTILSDSVVDCQDMSAVVQLFARILGEATMQVRRIDGPFYYKRILAIGSLSWKSDRWMFHQFGWNASGVSDACVQLDETNPYVPSFDDLDGHYKTNLFDRGVWTPWTPHFIEDFD